ncbi:MAG TPA: hypothetical protein VFU99_05035 [Gaiellaceae bacterium]|nr:hypothetical protein [Gaiellaceae bacterium]HEX4746231.1 hypothetical protein [Gaiellaceae bacterium]
MDSGAHDRGGLAEARVGDAVVADDGELGRVETVVRSESRVPLYLIIETGSFVRRRHPVVSCCLVRAVDRANRRVHIRGRRSRLRQLPESAPIAF